MVLSAAGQRGRCQPQRNRATRRRRRCLSAAHTPPRLNSTDATRYLATTVGNRVSSAVPTTCDRQRMSAPHSESEAALTRQLQQAADRRLRTFARRLHDDGTDDEHTAYALSEFEVDDVECRRILVDGECALVSVPTWMVPAAPEPLRIAVRAIHPSREAANEHLEQKSTDGAESSRGPIWLEKRSWRLQNYAIDSPPIELSEVRLCCATNDDDDADDGGANHHLSTRRIHFSTPLLQSLRVPGDLHLSHRLSVDDQASQIAFHTADAEQQAYLAVIGPTERAAVKRVVEEEYQRMTEVITFADEAVQARLGPVTAQLLPCLARILHRFGMPLTMHTSTLLYAVSGFHFLQSILVHSTAVHQVVLQTLLSESHEEQARSQLEQILQNAVWPENSINDDTMRIAHHTTSADDVVVARVAALAIDDSRPDEELAEDDPDAHDGLAEVSQEIASNDEDAVASSTAIVTALHASSAPSPSSLPSSASSPPITTLPALIASYLSISDWVLELFISHASSSKSHASSKRAPRGRHAKGRTKGKR